jgi:fatty-acyl-CoA synthase
MRASLTPSREALRFKHHSFTYIELAERAEQLARQLAAHGVQKGDRVSILARNHPAHLKLILATTKLGYIYTPLNDRLSAQELLNVMEYIHPKILFVEQEHAALAGDSGTMLVQLEQYYTWLQESAPPVPPPVLSLEDTQMILFTGGTTGVPMGAMQPYRQGIFNTINTVLAWGLRDDDSVIQTTPCFHAAVNALAVPLLSIGGKVILQDVFDAGEYLKLVEKERPTILFMVPTMFKMLIEHPAFSHTDFGSVRWAVSGGAPCPEPVQAAFRSKGVPFRQGYGLTEGGVNCFAISPEDAAVRPNAVGKPVLYAKAVLRDEAGNPVPQGDVGELTLYGPHVFSGYFDRPDETAKVLKNGWLWTGDLARQDGDGFFFICGRRKEMFISGGENVFPSEVENALYTHPAVSECAVVGIPDPHWGEVGLAVVVPRPATPIGPEELKEHLKSRLAGYKMPKQIHIAHTLPKSGAGKILKTVVARDFKGDPHGTL